jgi:hypothetical protein
MERSNDSYLHPNVFNQPEEKIVFFVQHPELVQRINASRKNAKRTGEN